MSPVFTRALAAAALAAAIAAAAAAAGPVLDATTQQFLDRLAASGGPPIHTLSPEAARGVLATAQAGHSLPPASVAKTTFPVGPTGSLRVRVVRPADAKGSLPVLMYFHGGGWMLGDESTHDRLVRDLAAGAGVAVVFVDYDRSPEAPYPAALDQAYAATKYVAENGRKSNLDPLRLAVAGDSAGGNLAAAVALLAKERRGPDIRFQLLFYPVTDADFTTASYQSFANGPWLTRDAMEWFWNAYLPDVAGRQAITASPLRATLDQLRGLPEALVITAENDVLRDQGEAYARKLTQAGVRVTSTRYNGTIHDFVMLNALAGSAATRAAIAQANEALRNALHAR